MRSARWLGVWAVIAIALTTAASVEATIVTYNVNTVFSGTSSGGTAPFITLQFDDSVVPGSVRLTASAPGLTATEFVSQINFNLDPALNASELTYPNFQILSGVMLHPQVFLGNDALEAADAGFFDVQFNFAVSGGGLARRFSAGESFSLDLGGIAGLDAESFDFQSIPPALNGAQLLAANIKNLADDNQSGWHTIPEPSAVAILAMAAAGMRRRRFVAIDPD